MKFRISAYPIYRGRVLENTGATGIVQSQGVMNEDIGRIVLNAVSEARKRGYYMNDPEMWMRLEFRTEDE